MIQRIFITNPSEFENYNMENGDSCSYHYYFNGTVFIMCDLKIPEGYGIICNKIYISTDVKFELGCKEYLGNIPKIKYLSRKQILRVKANHDKLVNRMFVCLGCGAIIPRTEMKCKNKKLVHYEHYWCENLRGLKEMKPNIIYLVLHRMKGHGNKIYKERIELLKNQQLKRTKLTTLNTQTNNFYYKYLGY